MVLNSFSFLIFFLFFFLIYWLVFKNSLKLQNLFLLSGNYIFYATWDWRFLFLLIGSSLLNYCLGIAIAKSENQKTRRFLLFIGLLQGLGTLFIFKYFNFFAGALQSIFTGLQVLNLLLPLGISFYTFRTIGYLLDVDKRKIEPVKNWIVFFNYVSFFPCLIAGPIDRPGLMVPQLNSQRVFKYNEITDGLKQILWGLFKKIVIADNCATLTNYIFENHQQLPASTLVAGAFFYTMQIYADFSGYSDMAIGIARLIGFNITRNFDGPFFALNIAEFWRRWHISLTSWMTEYLFTPLNIAFRNLEQAGLILAIVINFTIIGIWHGANWTFILFGFLHGCYFIPLILKGSMNKRQKLKGKFFPNGLEFGKMLFNLLLVAFTFILFRSPTLHAAFRYYNHIFSTTIFSMPQFGNQKNSSLLLFFIILMLAIEWFQREKKHALQMVSGDIDKENTLLSKSLRWSVYIVIVFLILGFAGREQDFIYLKF